MNLLQLKNKSEVMTRALPGTFIVRKRGDVVLGFYKIKSLNVRHVVTDHRTFTYQELFNFAKVFLLTGEVAPKEDAAPQFKDDAQFILWSPKSNLPPRVVLDNGVDDAMRIARDMARRHSGKFYVAHLVGVAEEKVTQRVIRDVSFESRML